MDAEQVFELLRQRVKEAGSQAEFCRKVELSSAQVSQALCGMTKYPAPAILGVLGLKKIISYEPKK